MQVLWLAALAGWAVATLIGVSWLLASRKTDRSLLRVGPITRGLRWYRSLWLRAATNIAGWPHLVDRSLGTHRASVMASPSDVVWKDGKATLTRLRTGPKGGPAVLVVHSLISKP